MQGNTPVECEILNVIQGAGIWPDCDDKTQLLQAIESLITGGGSGGGGIVTGSEIGTVSAFAMPTPPTGWLVCDGSAISRTEYADLFATIGTLWGHGDEVSTFNLPDPRGEFVRGFDDGRGVDSGRVFASAQLDQMQKITGSAGFAGSGGGDRPINVEEGAFIDGGEVTGGGFGFEKNGGFTPAWHGLEFDSSASPAARTGNETRPRNIAMTYAIKAFYPSAS